MSDESVGASDAIGAAGLIRVPRRTEAEQADDAAQRVHRESLAPLPRAAERRHDATPRAAETDPAERERSNVERVPIKRRLKEKDELSSSVRMWVFQ